MNIRTPNVSIRTALHTSSVSFIIGGILVATGIYGLVSAQSAPKVEGVTQASTTVTNPIDLSAGQWNYLPGATATTAGVVVHDQAFKIVEQDGSGGQPNPPVNLYGTHLAVKGNFKINAKVSSIVGSASFRLYGDAPKIADEFRVEPPSIELVMSQGQLVINMWDGSDATDLATSLPTFTQTYPATITDSAAITITHSRSSLIISINGSVVATVDDLSVFHAGQVWFGASSTGGDYLLSNMTAQPLGNGSMQALDASTIKATSQLSTKYLQVMAAQKRPGFIVGAAMALAPAASDPQYDQIAFGGNFGSLTTENALKWQFSEPAQGVYDFHEADALVDLAQRHNMVVHGHTLVFGEANPAWVTNLPVATDADKAAVQTVMTEHITTVASHYKGKIASWDVVNEPLADYDDFDADNGKILRNNIWYQAMGDSYITTAFQTAHAADPKAKLFINEYGLEANGDRWNAFLALVTKLKQAGVPIDGVGFEAHIYDASDKINVNVLKAHMQKLAALGLVSRVSEMDVYDDDGTAVQAKQFANVFAACLNEPSCVSWTTWGVSDRYDMYQEDNQPNYGNDLLWDNKMRPTKALTTILTNLAP